MKIRVLVVGDDVNWRKTISITPMRDQYRTQINRKHIEGNIISRAN